MNKKIDIEKYICKILEYIGEDTNRQGLQKTPCRVKNMLSEIFKGYDIKQKPKITTFRNGEDGIFYKDIIIDKGNFYSICEHHLMPFFGKYLFAYIPNPKGGKIIGLSKIGRIVDYCSAKLQIQERLSHDILNMIKESLNDEKYQPLGLAIIMEAKHLCKTMRGVKKSGNTITNVFYGNFEKDINLRNELLKIMFNN